MKERVLTRRELNRALLARQLLLDRAALPVTRALERVGGLQTQYAPSGYIGLWSRVRGFQRDALTRALEQRRVAQGTLMRSTIHLVSAGDYWLLAAGVRRGRQEWWRRVTQKASGVIDMAAAAALVREHLERGPRRASELKGLLASNGYPAAAWTGLGLWVDMVRVPPSGTWEQRRADLYGLASQWLPRREVSEADGIEHLVRRYLGAFGPASLKDIANWTGVAAAMHHPAIVRLGLRRCRDERGAELLDLPGAPLPDADTPAPVRLLPTWDASLLVHARRTLILPEKFRLLVFNTRMPQSVGTVLVDGAVVGSWRYDGHRVRVEPFEVLAPSVRHEVEDEAERLSAFITR